jgi:hypothetical protein
MLVETISATRAAHLLSTGMMYQDAKSEVVCESTVSFNLQVGLRYSRLSEEAIEVFHVHLAVFCSSFSLFPGHNP